MKFNGHKHKPAKASIELTITHSMIENLAEVGWRDRRKLPTQGGIYFIQVNFGIAYIGKSENLRKRWKSHERLAEIRALYPEACIRYLVVEDPDERNRTEAVLLKHFNPPWEGRVWNRVEESRWGKRSRWEWFGYPIEVLKDGARFTYKFFAPYDRGQETSNYRFFSTHREALEAAKKHIELEYTFLSASRWIEKSVEYGLISVKLYDALGEILPPSSLENRDTPLAPFFITRDI